MDLDKFLDGVKDGSISREDARRLISLEFIKTTEGMILDINRELRSGIPEIIYGEYKPYDRVISLSEKILEEKDLVIVSRFPDNERLRQHFFRSRKVEIHQNIAVIGEMPEPHGDVLVVSAGCADHPVVMEVEITLRALGVKPHVFEDRGIAHPTRVIEALESGIENRAGVVIVIAGMEGALAPFISALMPVPVIGVPTSVGYGYKAGETALISMLASCSPNLTVVNVDGGLRAAVSASLIVKQK